MNMGHKLKNLVIRHGTNRREIAGGRWAGLGIAYGNIQIRIKDGTLFIFEA
jgi:hypothetical protein